MLLRLEELLESENCYNFVIIQGGTNELNRNLPGRIFNNLVLMHKEAMRKGSKSVAVTIPELFQEREFEWLGSSRRLINDQLKEFCRKFDVPLIDLANMVNHN